MTRREKFEKMVNDFLWERGYAIARMKYTTFPKFVAILRQQYKKKFLSDVLLYGVSLNYRLVLPNAVENLSIFQRLREHKKVFVGKFAIKKNSVLKVAGFIGKRRIMKEFYLDDGKEIKLIKRGVFDE